MKGLMIKEIIMIKKMLIPIILFVAVGIMSGVFGGNPFFVYVIALFLPAIVIGNYNRDELSKWNQYSIAMPWERKTVVSFRYVFMLTISLVSVVLSLACYLLSVADGGCEFSGEIMTVIAVGSFAISLLLPTFCTPIILKFSSNTAMYALMLVGGGIGGLSAAIFSEDDLVNIAGELSGIANLIPYIIAVAILVLYAVSWAISLKIYQKKDI